VRPGRPGATLEIVTHVGREGHAGCPEAATPATPIGVVADAQPETGGHFERKATANAVVTVCFRWVRASRPGHDESTRIGEVGRCVEGVLVEVGIAARES